MSLKTEIKSQKKNLDITLGEQKGMLGRIEIKDQDTGNSISIIVFEPTEKGIPITVGSMVNSREKAIIITDVDTVFSGNNLYNKVAMNVQI